MRPLGPIVAVAMVLAVVGCATGPSTVAAAPTPVATPAKAVSSDDSRVYRREDLTVANVKLAGKPFRLWIMDNGGKRQEGMMFLRDTDVEDDQGMFFAFPDVQKANASHGFWMRNCPLGLDIIYVSPENRVVNVGDGKPFSEANVPPSGDYKNVIELKAGTAARIGLKPGMTVEIPKGLKPEADEAPPMSSPAM